MLVYPIVFLYRHFLELALKETIRIAHEYFRVEKKYPNGHNIEKLWQTCRPLLEKAFPDDSPDDLENVEAILVQYSIKDPQSTLFRYPVEKDGSEISNEQKRLNLENLKNVMGGIDSFFYGVQSAMEERTSSKT